MINTKATLVSWEVAAWGEFYEKANLKNGSKWLVNDCCFIHFVIPVIHFANNERIATGHKTKIERTFRRRIGRFLNVLRTFSLRPESWGQGVSILIYCCYYWQLNFMQKSCKIKMFLGKCILCEILYWGSFLRLCNFWVFPWTEAAVFRWSAK